MLQWLIAWALVLAALGRAAGLALRQAVGLERLRRKLPPVRLPLQAGRAARQRLAGP